MSRPAGAAAPIPTLLAAGYPREPKGASFSLGPLDFDPGVVGLADGRRFEWPEEIVTSYDGWTLSKQAGVGEPLHLTRLETLEYDWVLWDPITGFSVIHQPAAISGAAALATDPTPPKPTHKRYIPAGTLSGSMGALTLDPDGPIIYLDHYWVQSAKINFTAADGVRLTKKPCDKAELAVDAFGQVRRFVWLHDRWYIECGWYEILTEDGPPPPPREITVMDLIVALLAKYEVRVGALAAAVLGVLCGALLHPLFALALFVAVPTFLLSCHCALSDGDEFYRSVE